MLANSAKRPVDAAKYGRFLMQLWVVRAEEFRKNQGLTLFFATAYRRAHRGMSRILQLDKVLESVLVLLQVLLQYKHETNRFHK